MTKTRLSPVNGLRAGYWANSPWPLGLLHLFIAELSFLTVPRSTGEH